MKLWNLNPPVGRVMIGPITSRSGSRFHFSWQQPVQTGFNDGGQSFSNFLTTDYPGDPIAFLNWDPGIENVSTVDLGGGFWQVMYDTTVNFGGVGPTNAFMRYFSSSFRFVFPGMFYTGILFQGGQVGQTYKKNTIPIVLPFSAIASDNIEVQCPLAVAGGNSGSVFVTDNRMALPTATLTSGNGFMVSDTFLPFVNHASNYVIQAEENPPFGGTTLVVLVGGLGLSINYVIGL